ncbi:MAG: response regulator transcription factor, partial [Campylobacter sp.]|nr:response regulator transcription factor [Campylobacter sp.]
MTRILVVEDESMLLEMMCDYLSDYSYDVVGVK